MNERSIQAVPAHNDEVVLKHSYPIRVQNAIIQQAISADGLTLTAAGRLNQTSVQRILNDIEPIMALGRESEKRERKRESDVYKLEIMRKRLITLGVVRPQGGKLLVNDNAETRPSNLFNLQLLPEVTAILTKAVPMFTRLQFRPFVDFVSAIADGQNASTALRSVSEHVRGPIEQNSVLSSVISPQILRPFFEVGLLVNFPICTTRLWDEVIRIS